MLENYAGIHLEDTAFPWQEEANVYLAGHRLDPWVTESMPGRNILTLQTCTLPDYTQRLITQA